MACGALAGRIEPLCGGCRAALRRLDEPWTAPGGVEVTAAVAYEGPARAVVSALKFGGAARLADLMAAQVAAGFEPRPDEKGVLVPVPLHPTRRRRRGYNQAELLAAAVAARTGLGVSDCLERRGRGTTQVGRGRSERSQAIEGAVAVRRRALLPAHALLVDDVATTGATLAACAGALRAARARSVRALVYARTPGR